MDPDFAASFVGEWESAWNAHDVERILTHYDQEVVFQSPYISGRGIDPSGEIHGKEALRAYWSTGLQAQSNLWFTVEDYRVSVDTIVINYRNHLDHAVSEVLRIRDGLVVWGCGSYAPGPALDATQQLDA